MKVLTLIAVLAAMVTWSELSDSTLAHANDLSAAAQRRSANQVERRNDPAPETKCSVPISPAVRLGLAPAGIPSAVF